MTVVDASVAVKWLFPEPGASAAQRLLDQDIDLPRALAIGLNHPLQDCIYW